jgi:hypothetical protein
LVMRPVELSNANSSNALTWRANCRCLRTNNLSRGYPGQCLVGFGIQNSAVNAKTSDLYYFGPS